MKKKSIKFEEVFGKYEKYAIGYMQGKIFRALDWNLTNENLQFIVEDIIEKDEDFVNTFKYSIVPKEEKYNIEKRTYAILAKSMLKKINEIRLNGNNN